MGAEITFSIVVCPLLCLPNFFDCVDQTLIDRATINQTLIDRATYATAAAKPWRKVEKSPKPQPRERSLKLDSRWRAGCTTVTLHRSWSSGSTALGKPMMAP